MIEADDGALYTGISTDVERRFKEHQYDKQKAAKFFRAKKAKAIVFQQACENRSEASKQEAAIKKLNRNQKLAIIRQGYYR